MKKYNFLLMLALLLPTACGDEFYEMNEDIKNPAEVPGESLFTSAQKNLVDQMVNTNVNYNIFRLFCQYWTETTYTDEARYQLVERNIPEQHWSELYRRTLKNLDEGARIISSTEVVSQEEAARNNKLQIIEILSVYTYSVLVESFGNIPYSEALDIEILLPQYDEDQEIYTQLLDRLNTAINNLDTGAGSFESADNMFHGDVVAWKRFANSLKLRMAMTLADVNPDLAKSTVEAAVANGVFTSNADNAILNYLTSPPNTNPLYIDLVASRRNDFVPANTVVDYMNELEDPRRKYYFDDNLTDDATGEVIYEGGIYGDNNTYSNYTHIADRIKEPSFGGLILDYSEVEFLLAEAVERGFNVGGTAEEHYNNAITASFLYWGGTESEAEEYLKKPEVAYATAEGDWDQKIGMQLWLAMYNRGYAGWLHQRRLDYPMLEPHPMAVSGFPVRLTYPIVEQTLNGSNWSAAADAIGGDVVETRLFFDMK